MAIPVYLWLKDDGGADIKGSVDVQDREGSIEVVAVTALYRYGLEESISLVNRNGVCGIQVVQNQRRGPGS